MYYVRKGFAALIAPVVFATEDFVVAEAIKRESSSYPCDFEAAVGLGMSQEESSIKEEEEEEEDIVEEVEEEEEKDREKVVSTPPLLSKKKRPAASTATGTADEPLEKIKDKDGIKKVRTIDAGTRRVRDTKDTKITPNSSAGGGGVVIERPNKSPFTVKLYDGGVPGLIGVIKRKVEKHNISPVDSVQLATHSPKAYWNAVYTWARDPSEGNHYLVHLLDDALKNVAGFKRSRRGGGAGAARGV
jgi:hypothetical protein